MSDVVEALRSVTGPDGCLSRLEELFAYECDGLTLHTGRPIAVVLPRSREEVQAERKNDAINSLAERMEQAGLLTDEEYKAMDAEVIAEVERAAEYAEASPVPDRDEIYAHVYADEFRGGLDRRDAWR